MKDFDLQVREGFHPYLEPEHQEGSEDRGGSRWKLGHLGQHPAGRRRPHQVRMAALSLFQGSTHRFLDDNRRRLCSVSVVAQSGSRHAGLRVGSEGRSQRGGGLCVDWQRRILSVLHAGDQPRKLPARLRWRADGGGALVWM